MAYMYVRLRVSTQVRRGDAELAAGHVERARVLFEEALARLAPHPRS